jgi:hypothetical protein
MGLGAYIDVCGVVGLTTSNVLDCLGFDEQHGCLLSIAGGQKTRQASNWKSMGMRILTRLVSGQ